MRKGFDAISSSVSRDSADEREEMSEDDMGGSSIRIMLEDYVG